MQTTANAVDASKVAPPILPCSEPDAPIQIVAVDADDCFRSTLSSELTRQGFSVATFADSPSVLEAIDTVSAADLVVLDWNLPSASGLALLQQLRRANVTTPVVFLTRSSFTTNETLALENGAVDFIAKSRGFSILAQRLRIVAGTKEREPQRDQAITLGKLLLRPLVSRAFWNGIDLDLTVGEFKIVTLLANNAGRHVTCREIYDALRYRGFVAGCGDNGYKTNVRSAIRRIRRKFEACDPAFAKVCNDAALGYILAMDEDPAAHRA